MYAFVRISYLVHKVINSWSILENQLEYMIFYITDIRRCWIHVYLPRLGEFVDSRKERLNYLNWRSVH